ncbi:MULTISPECIES: hypothetical protein [unclassified Streptomyces]|jgi:hypothetical protein|uniref:hypothetical protein n=1 Tax=unclassified Streptomyces TaxID=2593676 RepID=UPI000887C76C|nr:MULTISPECIES: hypothetical protein [unclassified Streptomyces]SCY10354.1 hypothetical protein SAMN02745898_101887 [Streptomyces sp. 136MFCol5.1]SFS91813.1 hypothetical protein SAMN04487982_104448 [Streptomyces sp. ok210]
MEGQGYVLAPLVTDQLIDQLLLSHTSGIVYWSCNAETISCCLGTQSVVAGVCTHQRKL